MKKFGVSFIVCVLCAILVGALPSFAAAQPRAYCPVNEEVTLAPIISEGAGPANVRLNIATNLSEAAAQNNLPDNTNVNVYTPTTHWSQKWYFTRDGRSDGYYMLRSARVTGHALNISFFNNSYLNCDVVRWAGNIKDSAVASNGAGAFGFQSQNYQQYRLAATGTTSGMNVKWHSNVAPPAAYKFAWCVY